MTQKNNPIPPFGKEVVVRHRALAVFDPIREPFMRPRHLFRLIFSMAILAFSALSAGAAIECNQCHGTSSPSDYRPLDSDERNPINGGFQGNHRTHLGQTTSSAACVKCHPGSAAYVPSHRDGLIKVSSRINNSAAITPYRNSTSAFPQISMPVPGTCANVNCHFETISPAWGIASFNSATDCQACHTSPGSSSSHVKHENYYPFSANGCIRCHPDYKTGLIFSHATSVAKRGIIVHLSEGAYSGDGADFLPSQSLSRTFGTCSNLYCHSPGDKKVPAYNAPLNTPQWGTSLPSDCTGCHGGAAGSASTLASGKHGAHINNAAVLGTNFGCAECHAKSVSGNTTIGTYSNHVNGFVDFSGVRAGRSSTYDSATGVCSATYCHSDGKGTAKSMATDNWKGATTLNCQGCHGSAVVPAFTPSSAGEPNYVNGSTATPRANSHQRHTRGDPASCDACHTDTTISGAQIKAGSTLHINGTRDVTFNPAKAGASVAWTAGTKTCANIACHGSGSSAAQWGSTSCLGCHSVPQGSRVAITPQFGAQSHHIQGAVTDAKCYQCHWEANSDGSINPAYHNAAVSGAAVRLVIYSSLQRPGNAGRYFIAYSANGTRAQIQKISNHCLGCHSDRNNTAQPFGDGKTPRQYAWDNTSVDARYSQSGTTSWGKYTSASYPNAAKKKITKALSAHGNGSANQRGWDTASGVDGTIANTSGAIAVQCYDCHNSHGSAVAGITSRYSSATGRNKGGLLKNTVKGYGGYSSTYSPQSAGSAADKDLRNPGASLCLDCHFSATPKQAPFAAFKGYTTPWGYNSTFNATQGILGYWDSPYMSYGPNVGAKQRYPFKGQNLIKGGHFGASSPLGSSLDATHQINGLCTPCHDPHGVSPTMGANQQYGVPLLKGTWLTSPYQEDTSPANNGDMLITGGTGLPYHIDQNTFGAGINNVAMPTLVRNDPTLASGLCLDCHSKASLTNGTTHTWKSKDRIHEAVKGWKSTNGTNQHSYTCSKCHSAHTSSVLPRLMVTNCLDGIHKGRAALRISPMTSFSESGDYGGGSGRIPGVYGGSGDDCGGFRACGTSFSVNCHEGNTGSGINQSWNGVTPWAVAAPPSAPTPTHQASSTSSGGNRNITLQWGAVTCSSGAATQYYAELSSSADFGVISYNTGWIGTVSWAQPLPLGTWYWRVKARDSVYTSAVSAPSATDTFTISYAPPAAPTLIAQTSSNSSGGDISKTFQWNAVTPTDVDPVQYLVEVSSASTFASIAYQSGWQAGTTWTQSIPIGTWYWRVTTRDSVHTTAVSAPSTTGSFSIFLTAPAAPTLTAQPATSYTSGTDKSITFGWSTVTAPDGDTCQYQVQVSSASTFASIAYQSGWQAGTSWTQALPIGTWYWRVTSRDSVHTMAVSSPSTFGTFAITYAAPAAPALIAQPNYSSGTDVAVTFQWNAVTPTDADPMEYYAEVSSAADFATITYQSAWQAATSWTQTVAPGTWYWRVTTRDSGHTTAVSASSATNSFTISTTPLPPIAPVLITQTDGNAACTTAYSHNLQWNAVTAPDGHAVEYYLQLDTTSSFNSANLQQPGWISATNWTTPSPIITGTWYWRVKARDAVDTAMESAYSATGSFTDTYTWTCDCDSSCSSSCPLVYSWDGAGYRYETDLQGPAISQIKKGLRNVTLYQPSYISLERLVPDANNQYRVKIWESLIEATLLDEAKLLAVDYPQGYQIASSGAENTYYYNYVDPFKIYTLKDPVPPLTATDKSGNDVLAQVLGVDNNPAPMNPDDPENFYTFDFGTIQHPENAKLVIDAWQIINSKIYLSTITIQPYVEVVDASGAWVKVKSFGMPMGDLKTMIVDLSGLFLSSDHRVRVHLGIKKAQVWVIDRIRLDDSAPVSVTVQELPASSANLQVGGHAIQAMNTEQHRILVNETALPPYPGYYGYGNFTGLGEVKELLTQRDDKYVIMNYADKLELLFPALPAPEAGMARGFILKADNYYKEFKEYKYLEPLPFHGMSDYPPPAPEAYPMDLDHNQYRQDYNTRIFTP